MKNGFCSEGNASGKCHSTRDAPARLARLHGFLYVLLLILLFVNPFIRYAFVETWGFPEPDWPIFFPAVRKLAAGESPYPREVLEGEPEKTIGKAWGHYIYPPLFARLLQPLLPLGFFWSLKFYLGLCLILYLWFLFPKYRKGPLGGLEHGLLVGIFFGWGPVIQTFRHGQSDFIPLFLFTAAWRLLRKEPPLEGGKNRIHPSHRMAGILLGVASTIKLTPAVVWPVLVAAGRYSVAGGFVLGVVLSLVLTGPVLSFQYFTRVLPSLADFAVMKDRPALHLGVAHLMETLAVGLPSGAGWKQVLVRSAAYVGILASVLAYGGILWFCWRSRSRLRTGDLLLISCFLPPIFAGELNHHYTLALLPVLVWTRREVQTWRDKWNSGEKTFRGLAPILLFLFLLTPCFYYWRPVRRIYGLLDACFGLTLNTQLLFGTTGAFLLMVFSLHRGRYEKTSSCSPPPDGCGGGS